MVKSYTQLMESRKKVEVSEWLNADCQRTTLPVTNETFPIRLNISLEFNNRVPGSHFMTLLELPSDSDPKLYVYKHIVPQRSIA